MTDKFDSYPIKENILRITEYAFIYFRNRLDQQLLFTQNPVIIQKMEKFTNIQGTLKLSRYIFKSFDIIMWIVYMIRLLRTKTNNLNASFEKLIKLFIYVLEVKTTFNRHFFNRKNEILKYLNTKNQENLQFLQPTKLDFFKYVLQFYLNIRNILILYNEVRFQKNVKSSQFKIKIKQLLKSSLVQLLFSAQYYVEIYIIKDYRENLWVSILGILSSLSQLTFNFDTNQLITND